MDLLLGYLPEGVDETDVRTLISRFSKVTKVKFLTPNGGERSVEHSDYECIVTMEASNPSVENIITNNINHMCWRGCSIKAHRLIF